MQNCYLHCPLFFFLIISVFFSSKKFYNVVFLFQELRIIVITVFCIQITALEKQKWTRRKNPLQVNKQTYIY